MTALACLVMAMLIPHGGRLGQSPPAQQLPRDPRSASPAPAGTIRGIVTTDEVNSRPLRRARVTLSGAGTPRMVITGDDGAFVFTHVPSGHFTVGAAKDGYVATAYGAAQAGRGIGLQLASGESVSVSLRLSRGAVVTGTVIDVDGLPAPGIPVAALTRRFVGGPVQYRYSVNGTPAAAVTDDRGIYRIFGLPAGDYVIAARPTSRERLESVAAVHTMSGGVVSGPGRILTQVFYPGAIDAADATRVSVRAGEERSGLDISLQYVPLATLSGLAPPSAGWTPAIVTLARTDENLGYENGRAIRADASGAFAFSGVSPGRYRVVAVSRQSTAASSGSSRAVPSGDALAASADVVVSGEDVANLMLALQPALTMSGRVVFEGEHPSPPLGETTVNVPLNLTLADAGYPFPRVQLGANGTFRVEGIVPGRYFGVGVSAGIRAPIASWWLKSIVADGRDLLDGPLDLRRSIDDAIVTFADRASEISGTVRDARGAPVLEGYVVAFSSDRSAWFPNSRRVGGVRPGRDGSYVIRNLPPGEYRVVAADLDANEWFDPAVLERLLPLAMVVRITGTEKTTLEVIRR